MYAILDIEAIQRDKDHACVRKLYILSSNGINCEREFDACLPFQKLEKKYQMPLYIAETGYTSWIIIPRGCISLVFSLSIHLKCLWKKMVSR